MKLKKDLVLRKIAGKYMIMPVGRLSRICKPLHITSSAAFMWKIMEQGEFTEDSLVDAGLQEYTDATDEMLRTDIRTFMNMLDRNYMLDSGRPEPVMGLAKIEVDKDLAKHLREGERHE